MTHPAPLDGRTIALLHYAGPPTIGGVEATIAAHARLFADDGWQVRIITGKAASTDPRIAVVSHPLLGSRGELLESVNAELARGIVSDAFHELVARIAATLADALAGCSAAIVHNVLTLHKNLAFTAALRQLHDAGNLPTLLAWCHDFAWRDPLYSAELHDGAPWNLLRSVWPGVQYVAVSEDRRQMLAELLALPPESIAVVPPGIDLPAFLKLEPETTELVRTLPLLESAPLLVLPARITRRKNIEQAIAITGALRRRGLKALLVVMGPPGPHNPTNAAYLAQLQQLRASSGAAESVVFLYEHFTDGAGAPRPVSDAMIADLFRLADGLLFPSRYEGFGIPLLEAGLAGIPIFCSDIAPFRAIAGDAAMRFPAEGDADAIAGELARALSADIRGTFRRQVRQQATWQAVYRRDILPLLGADPPPDTGGRIA